MRLRKIKIKSHERSFTLIETVIALGLMVAVIFEVSGVQGNAIYFSEYERNVTKATWLAKGVMSEIEYNWKLRPFSEFEYKESEKPFKDLPEKDFEDFTYTVEIAEWKLPILSLIGGGGPGGQDDENDSSEADPTAGGMADMATDHLEAIFGDDILKIAKVQVYWPEGAQKNSVELSLLLTNQKALDEKIATIEVKEKNSNNESGKDGGFRSEADCLAKPGDGCAPTPNYCKKHKNQIVCNGFEQETTDPEE